MPVSSAAAVGSGRSTSMSLAFCSPAPPTSPYQRSDQPNTLWNREANLVLLQPLALSLVRLHRPMLARDSLDPACNATRIHPGEAVPAPSFSRRLPGLGDLMRAGLTLRSRGGGSSERADPGSETMSESSRGEGLRPRSDILRNPSSMSVLCAPSRMTWTRRSICRRLGVSHEQRQSAAEETVMPAAI
jgi:hypothetical protein